MRESARLPTLLFACLLPFAAALCGCPPSTEDEAGQARSAANVARLRSEEAAHKAEQAQHELVEAEVRAKIFKLRTECLCLLCEKSRGK